MARPAVHHLRFGGLSALLFSEAQRRTPWLGRHLFWLKSASVLKSTAICQPMATCHQSSNSLLEIAGSPERSRRAGVRLCGLKWRSGGRIDWEAEAKKVHRDPR